ncbi:hypothetical protein BDY17DRAFT_301509 [Neohortaea acidophila]|uniref:Uncharacterized protein n=1 Tax=Neohortaea acidophila TaxID=245834 RepID=A0A6A6PNG2_9PEZI|nr:uncharacterized protein BDY17DRAFT_301509 [Neohortaea acidophila]KAF2481542.1 hypothetical protein BDY17DRAFT_301509 [Neohortaea acidophila]
MRWFCILASTGFAVSAIIRPTIPATTLAPSTRITPSPVFARQVTSCALVGAPAFTISGRTYPASSSCTCNGGVQAGASRTVGPDGKTTWECAAKSTPMPISTEEAAPTTTLVMQLLLGVQKFMIGDYDQTNFLPLMKSDCGLVCDSATQEHIKFNRTHSGGSSSVATSTVVMTGTLGNSVSEQALMTAVNTALLKTSQCTQVATAFFHDPIRWREIDPPPPDLFSMPCSQLYPGYAIQQKPRRLQHRPLVADDFQRHLRGGRRVFRLQQRHRRCQRGLEQTPLSWRRQEHRHPCGGAVCRCRLRCDWPW